MNAAEDVAIAALDVRRVVCNLPDDQQNRIAGWFRGDNTRLPRTALLNKLQEPRDRFARSREEAVEWAAWMATRAEALRRWRRAQFPQWNVPPKEATVRICGWWEASETGRPGSVPIRGIDAWRIVDGRRVTCSVRQFFDSVCDPGLGHFSIQAHDNNDTIVAAAGREAKRRARTDPAAAERIREWANRAMGAGV